MKTEWLQVRMTRAQKAALRRRARAAGMDISAYVLLRVLPDPTSRFPSILADVATPSERRLALAELHDLLAGLTPAQFAAVGPGSGLATLTEEDRNLVAAMIEHAAARRKASPPAWVRTIPPLESPHFASDLRSLRAHLLRSSPVAFRRRNIFVDSSVGDRV